ncbi:unnamed protein product [Brassicogethes aeneus]|uniref:Integrase catalytic domain-containing protein n=1 Tax=Brassicogethes aeneus TaxID=1431903 RepID=A0A9P0FNP4_BRAAE|nr:unnamed protein product [Brassicogethes aeneus]
MRLGNIEQERHIRVAVRHIRVAVMSSEYDNPNLMVKFGSFLINRNLGEIACNITYYGGVGHTYELEVKRPNDSQLPFLCYLTFTAAGGTFGELVQLKVILRTNNEKRAGNGSGNGSSVVVNLYCFCCGILNGPDIRCFMKDQAKMLSKLTSLIVAYASVKAVIENVLVRPVSITANESDLPRDIIPALSRLIPLYPACASQPLETNADSQKPDQGPECRHQNQPQDTTATATVAVTRVNTAIAQRNSVVIRMKSIFEAAESAEDSDVKRRGFKVRYVQVKTLYQTFFKQHSIILAHLANTAGSDLESHHKICNEFEEMYYYIQGVFSNYEPDTSANDSFASQTNTNVTPNISSHIRLPRIELPKFSGEIREWKTFIDMFIAMVHDNASLSNVEKFNYLRASLVGSPLAIVTQLPLTGANYKIAYAALLKRYENRRILATAHWRAIENANKIPENCSSPETIRQLISTFTENIAALKNLKFPTAKWDFILFQMLLSRLDTATSTRFELEQGDSVDTIPSFEELEEFLTKQCTAYEAVAFSAPSAPKRTPQTSKSLPPPNNSFSKPRQTNSYLNNVATNLCPLCNVDHLLYKCPKFLEKTPRDRFELIKTRKWCVNCLSSKHTLFTCRSENVCRTCSKRHHSLIHFTENINSNPASSQSHAIASTSATLLSNSNASHSILLATAVAEILDSRNKYQKIRILLDSASQCNIITQSCATKLGLRSTKSPLSIKGLGSMNVSATLSAECHIRPANNKNSNLDFDAIILPQICNHMPTSVIMADWPHISNLKLADPQFCSPGDIDMLLGAEIFPYILLPGRVQGSKHHPVALNTIFGWVLMGKIGSLPAPQVNNFLTISNDELNNTLKMFWHVEEVPKTLAISDDDKLCETTFTKTHTRNTAGRYCVTLPFKNTAPQFNNSRFPALKCFYNLERKLAANPDLYAQYSDFMREYLSEGHMEEIKNIYPNENAYYIPHHAVVTSKLRVVFNASFRTANNLSLNDALLIGPKLQQDLLSIFLNFRLNRIAFTADIRQMYRQIEVTKSHQDFQRILWRFSPTDPVSTYRLLTVTYGVNSSPFLAIRTIQQLANDEGRDFPRAANVLNNDMYVDDIVSGGSTLDDAKNLQNDLISILGKGGFELRKWASNCPALLAHLPESYKQVGSCDFEQETTVKILGLRWNSATDSFLYQVEPQQNSSCTKRTILSQIARIFDVVGFLSPVIITAKYLVQHLWSLGLDWDEPPPADVLNKWQTFKSELPLLSNVSIPRFVAALTQSCQLHGFCDGSEKAYAAVVYLRISPNDSDQAQIYLICAKSRVAPLKRLSVPRLELCAAVLLADLLYYVYETYKNKLTFENIYAWSDSTIALSWIKSSPHRWLTFVGNRVSHIQSKVAPENWRHVSTLCNPADCASRGVMPSEIVSHALWWTGPPWLQLPESSWPRTLNSVDNTLAVCHEERKITLANVIETTPLDKLIHKYSSLNKLQRIIAYVLRFINNAKPAHKKRTDFFTQSELHDSLLVFVKYVQKVHFSAEISALLKHRPVSKYLRKLNIFLDSNNIVRVGGRLRHSNLSFEQKHPALLPGNHRFVKLLVQETHNKHLHPGTQTMQYLLAQNFWILSSKQVIRKVTSKCLRCWKLNPKSPQPQMGDLPPLRISQLKCFSVVGVDYAGPFSLLMSKNRGTRTIKGYICVFICFATKAIHLELASDLSSEAFLAALRRFIARRGRCSQIFSDCGTNFVGANKQILSYFKTAAASESLKWSFNPPSAPHFGGLWEAGVKSVKTHLYRVIGEQILSYEEFYTVLTQIEAILNSRPLCSFSVDPNDVRALTPGHFLTLEPLSCLPDPDLQSVPLNRLSRWQLLQRMHQDFWARWHAEYLHTLSQRIKWTSESCPIKVGSVVLLKNELSPPLQWRLGRVETLHPGKDGVVRVVTVRTNLGTFKRPVVKVCPLPQADLQ